MTRGSRRGSTCLSLLLSLFFDSLPRTSLSCSLFCASLPVSLSLSLFLCTIVTRRTRSLTQTHAFSFTGDATPAATYTHAFIRIQSSTQKRLTVCICLLLSPSSPLAPPALKPHATLKLSERLCCEQESSLEAVFGVKNKDHRRCCPLCSLLPVVASDARGRT